MGFVNVNQVTTLAIANLQYDVTTEGATVVISGSTDVLLCDPSSNLTAAVLTFPDYVDNGQIIRICVGNHSITGVTFSSATATFPTIVPAGLTVGSFVAFIYKADTLQWFRCG